MTEHDAVIAILKRMLQRAISRRPEPACDVGRWTTVRYGPPCANDEAFSAPDRAAMLRRVVPKRLQILTRK